MRFNFRDGDRVRLIAGYPVREDYWGREGTVIQDWPDVNGHDQITVVYDFRQDYETWSRADTLIPICDDLDTDKISAFIEEM